MTANPELRRRSAGVVLMALGTATLLSGCAAVGPNYRPASPAVLAVPANYTALATAGAPIDLATWWQQFHDPLLTDLIARATASSRAASIAPA
jgi:outer membrane protein TolC